MYFTRDESGVHDSLDGKQDMKKSELDNLAEKLQKETSQPTAPRGSRQKETEGRFEAIAPVFLPL